MITMIEIHIASNCTGQSQRTKRIKPQLLESVAGLETIRSKIRRRYEKRGQVVEVFFVYLND